jgi:hypothetical protein
MWTDCTQVLISVLEHAQSSTGEDLPVLDPLPVCRSLSEPFASKALSPGYESWSRPGLVPEDQSAPRSQMYGWDTVASN